MTGGPAATDASKPVEDYRLPTDVKPKHYDITIRTDLEKSRFDGFVVAHLDVLKETAKLVFNSSNLTLGQAKVASAALKEDAVVPASAFQYDEPSGRVSVDLPVTLPIGSQLQLRIDFEGELTGSMMGYYRSSWEDEGKTKYYALTQFEPTEARKAFPCWDEPLLKASFALTMVSRANTVNLNNMPVVSEEVYTPSFKDSTDVISWLSSKFSEVTVGEGDKWKITKFDTTPPMSTYIVAFANGPFEYLEDSYTSPLSGKARPLRLYATKDVVHQGQFALEVKKKVLPLYEQVFDIEYPLPKLDTLVANDFDAAAMENWGLITGATVAYLVDPEITDLASKKRIAATQSHEVAHMWFGNITTMQWWDNLYLNEGFATLMGEVIILDKVFPEWQVHSTFISDILQSALSLDAKLSSHPIEVECPDANTINQIFDSLSYSKAGSVLRMLSKFVGEETFLKGVSIYLKKHLYANSVTKDLWAGIQEASGMDIPKIMDNWVKKMGFPVITVKETEGGIIVRQDRFLETGPASPEDNETLWSVPLGLLTVDENGKAKINHSILLEEREMTIPLDTSKPFKLNAGTTGVYRVLYTPERLIAIANEAAKADSLFSLEDRVGLVHDALALARAGYMDLSAVLSLYNTFKHEEEHLVWSSMSDSLSNLASIWYEKKEILDKLNAFRRELFVPLVQRLGYEDSADDSVASKELRMTAVSISSHAGEKTVIEELRSRFKKSMEAGDDSCIPPDLTRITYTTSVKHGGRTEYDQVKAVVLKPKTPSFEIAAIAAMCASQDPVLAEETWEYVMTKARDQDVPQFFRGFWANASMRRFLITKFRDNYDVLYERLKGNSSLQRLVKVAHMGLSSDKDWEESKAFFEGKDVSKFNMALQQSLDGIKTRSAFIQRSSHDLAQWLDKRQK